MQTTAARTLERTDHGRQSLQGMFLVQRRPTGLHRYDNAYASPLALSRVTSVSQIGRSKGQANASRVDVPRHHLDCVRAKI